MTRRVLLVLLLLTSASAAQAARLFDATAFIVPKPAFPQAATLADLDRDGLADMVTVLEAGVGVARAVGGGEFAPDVVSFADHGTVWFVDLADVDGDGLLDLPAAYDNADSSGVIVLFGDGNGGWSGSFEMRMAGLQFLAIAAGDLDGDGRADLVYGMKDSSIVVFQSNDNRTISLVQTIPSNGFVSIGGVITDIVGSSAPDLVISSFLGPAIYEGNGDGTLGARTDVPVGARHSVRVAQVDGVLGKDLVTERPAWIPSTGPGTFGSEILLPASGGFPRLAEARDFDGNGTIDVIATPFSPYRGVVFWPGDGAGGFGPAVVMPLSGFDPTSLSLGDVDGDGRPDLAFQGAFTYEITVSRGQPGGRFGLTHLNPYVAGRLSAPVAADFDRDGHLDAVGSEIFLGRMAFAKGHGDGTFDPLAFGAVFGASYTRLVVGQFDADSLLDVVGNTSASTTSFLRGHGDGTFDNPVDFALPNTARGLVAADIDGDADLDIAIPVADANAIVTLRHGAAGLEAPVTSPTLPGPVAVVYADLSGDGLVDRVVSGATSWRVELGNGAGGYVPQAAHAQSPPPGDLALADLDEDGRLDLMVAPASNYPALVHVWRGQPGGVFDSESIADLDWTLNPFANKEAVSQMVLRDFDEDGHLDVAVRSSSAASWCSVARGHGDRTFGTPEPYVAPGGAGVVPGDFDEDGHLDLVAGSSYTPSNPKTALIFVRNRTGGVVGVPAPERGPSIALAISQLVPNPSRGAFAFTLRAPARGEARISVHAANGRVLDSRTQAVAPGAQRVAFARGLAPGVYWVRVTLGGAAAASKFVVLP
jgi:hypothetical protein